MATFQGVSNGLPSSSPIFSADTIWSGSFLGGFQVRPGTDLSDDNFLSRSPGSDTLWGNAGRDILTTEYESSAAAGLGFDTLYGGDGADSLFLFTNGAAFGEGGNDFLSAGGGGGLQGQPYSFTMDGGAGDDRLTGSGGVNALLRGGDGNDQLLYQPVSDAAGQWYFAPSVDLRGGVGNDFLQSAQGAEMVGGVGEDIFALGRQPGSSGRHTITDFKDGVDKITFDRTFGSLSIRQSGVNTLIRDSSGMALALLENVQASSITLADFVR